jgi:hypothetical protein
MLALERANPLAAKQYFQRAMRLYESGEGGEDSIGRALANSYLERIRAAEK